MKVDNLPWRVLPEYAGGGIFVDVRVHYPGLFGLPAWPDCIGTGGCG